MKCSSCSADAPDSAAVCQHCGSPLLRTPQHGRVSLFDEIKRSPQYDQRNSPERHARLPRYSAIDRIFRFTFYLIFTAIAASVFVMCLGIGGVFGNFASPMGAGGRAVALVLAVVPLAMVGLGVFAIVASQKKMRAAENAPVQAIAAVILNKSHTSGDGDPGAQYFVTCEAESGKRHEYQVWNGDLYDRMAEGDAGVLFIRADYAVDFDRITVEG